MSTHFSVSIHCLLLLSQSAPDRITSSVIASSINTNPVVVRRIMGSLKKAGLVESSPGTRGFCLVRSDEKIHLRDIYEATKEDRPLFTVHQDTNPDCDVGRNIDALLQSINILAEQKVLEFFETITLYDLKQSIAQLDKDTIC
ncbi:Rrf2 family transcriptional regulator [Paenibacillus massiliensis]|uniref:Rrf2 family transcriptional regulator n=1 Tax=Paenibacillus massiliensis TaxID=225917 RepID=UPI0003609682|nr:Rrf2 family transcriptional regulator [Paenibacillus massiliensis]